MQGITLWIQPPSNIVCCKGISLLKAEPRGCVSYAALENPSYVFYDAGVTFFKFWFLQGPQSPASSMGVGLQNPDKI